MSSAKKWNVIHPDPASDDPAHSDDDSSLFRRIGLGQRDALRLLMDRYWVSLVGYADGITADRDVAQDVVQGAFLQVWEKRSDWQASGTPRAYLYRITRNLALNARRDSALRKQRQQEWCASELSPDFPRTPAEETEIELLRSEIESAIAALPERRREIFLLSRFPGLSYREIAETMGISVQTVSNQMSTALAQLRTVLAHHLDE
jgi:RNA polymerase sigma-70 factor (ECF subfamily)